ncbi:MAG: hypothetical protein ACRCZF_05780, partial [Gemmataceae bacterium]
ANSGIRATTTSGFVNDGIGQTRATATALALTGNSINSNTAKGIISPLSSDNPNPIGVSNYSTGFYSFSVGQGGSNVNITLKSGRSTLTVGTADEGATLNATLLLLDANGTVLNTSALNGIVDENITRHLSAAGTYFIQIQSAGGFTDVNGYTYFDMGSYFITGSITPVPEPMLIFTIVIGVGLGVRQARRTITV